MLSSQRYVFLDGLRGVAALAVLIYHFTGPFGTPWIAHGWLAVDFFFVLSGFVIASAYEERLRSNLSFRAFAWKRVIRLWPSLLMGVVIGAAAIALRTRADINWPALSIATLAGALLLPIRSSLDPTRLFVVNPPFWSLFFELVLNFGYAAGIRVLSNRVVVFLTALAALALVAEAVFQGSPSGNADWQGISRALFGFCIGVLIWRNRQRLTFKAPPVVILAIVVGVFLVPSFRWNAVFELAAIAAVFPLVIIAGQHVRPVRSRGICELSGRLSYPVYAIHWGLLPFFGHFVWRAGSPVMKAAVLLLGVVGIIVTAYVLLKFVDEPVRRWLGSRKRSTMVG